MGPGIIEFAPADDPIRLKWPTHIAFGHDGLQIITDLKNSRFVFRSAPDEPFRVAPITMKQPHSVVYNPFDQLYYANVTDNHRIIDFADLDFSPAIGMQPVTLPSPMPRARIPT